jgi:hypothetical protein
MPRSSYDAAHWLPAARSLSREALGRMLDRGTQGKGSWSGSRVIGVYLSLQVPRESGFGLMKWKKFPGDHFCRWRVDY